ncbi:MAG: type II toxin-antitoxin system mRNA interferase toxin, RelE/StbE family [Nanoarchaeota archaeon]
MYKLFVANKKTEKMLNEYINLRDDVKDKLDRLKIEPRRANGAHPLHGELDGKWACWIGSNIRLLYIIKEDKKEIVILAIGSHKVY